MRMLRKIQARWSRMRGTSKRQLHMTRLMTMGGASKPVLKRPAATLSSDGDGNGMAIEEQGLKWHLELNADAPPDLST